MKNKLLLYLLILAFMSIFLWGCNQGNTPEMAYWSYYDSCAEGKFDEAKELLTKNAVQTSEILGVCAFTHDAINTNEIKKGNPPRTFSEDPKINVSEKAASLIWLDDQGNIASVTLFLEAGEWKVADTTWSY
jgi:hypothetical protein